MTIDEAIKHAEKVAEKQEELYRLCPASESEISHCDGTKDCKTLKNGKNKGCQKCAKEHRQLAGWLKGYKRLLEQQPCDDAISRADRLLDLANAIESDDGGYWTNKRISSALKNISSISQESCDDAINRQAVLDQTYLWSKDEFLRVTNPFDYLRKRINSLQPVTPQQKIESCEDCISRKSIKQKLQEHHDFFVNAYGGFSNLPLNDKSRIDEITNCIAMVVNEPPVTSQPKTLHCKDCRWWKDSDGTYRRGVRAESQCPINRKEVYEGGGYCYMFEPQESENKE